VVVVGGVCGVRLSSFFGLRLLAFWDLSRRGRRRECAAMASSDMSFELEDDTGLAMEVLASGQENEAGAYVIVDGVGEEVKGASVGTTTIIGTKYIIGIIGALLLVGIAVAVGVIVGVGGGTSTTTVIVEKEIEVTEEFHLVTTVELTGMTKAAFEDSQDDFIHAFRLSLDQPMELDG
jgi:hypothetical protein